MDEEIESLEAELRGLTPVAPSVDVQQRIETALSPAAVTSASRERRQRTTRVAWFAAAMLPIAAAVAVLLRLPPGHQPTGAMVTSKATAAASPNGDGLLKPVSAENVLIAAQDEGVVTLANGIRARRERLNYIDTITWSNPRTHTSLTWSIPREEVRVTPVRYE